MSQHENIVGNVYDKYGTKNPIARALMQGFLSSVTELCRERTPSSILEVGCGEGRLAHHLLHSGLRPQRFVACDLELSRIISDADPRIDFQVASIYELPFDSGSFDLVVCCEVLEHIQHPSRGLRELVRVAKERLVVSTPREPLWRGLNLLRGKYWSDFGNTPGHVQHWSSRGLTRMVSTEARVIARKNPIPWTILLLEPKPAS